VVTAVAARVSCLQVGHRDPRRSDDQLAQLDNAVRELLLFELRKAGLPEDSCQACIPYEGMTLSL
jgi:hypothetical protein